MMRLAIAVIALAAASPPAVTGTITYRERIALAADAYVVVKLWDVTERANWRLLGTQTLRRPGQPPIAFAVAYAPERVTAAGDYVVEAQIHQGGQLRWINPAACPILTKGFPRTVTVTVREFTTGVPSVALTSRPPRDCRYDP